MLEEGNLMKKGVLVFVIIGALTCSGNIIAIQTAQAAAYQSNAVTGFYGEYVVDEDTLIDNEPAETESVSNDSEGETPVNTQVQRETHRQTSSTILPVTGDQYSLVLMLGGFILVGRSLYRLRYAK